MINMYSCLHVVLWTTTLVILVLRLWQKVSSTALTSKSYSKKYVCVFPILEYCQCMGRKVCSLMWLIPTFLQIIWHVQYQMKSTYLSVHTRLLHIGKKHMSPNSHHNVIIMMTIGAYAQRYCNYMYSYCEILRVYMYYPCDMWELVWSVCRFISPTQNCRISRSRVVHIRVAEEWILLIYHCFTLYRLY